MARYHHRRNGHSTNHEGRALPQRMDFLNKRADKLVGVLGSMGCYSWVGIQKMVYKLTGVHYTHGQIIGRLQRLSVKVMGIRNLDETRGDVDLTIVNMITRNKDFLSAATAQIVSKVKRSGEFGPGNAPYKANRKNSRGKLKGVTN